MVYTNVAAATNASIRKSAKQIIVRNVSARPSLVGGFFRFKEVNNISKLVIPDSTILKLKYEIKQFQDDDPAGDIAHVVIRDTIFDDYTRGYLSAKLEHIGKTLYGKRYLEEFLYMLYRYRDVSS